MKNIGEDGGYKEVIILFINVTGEFYNGVNVLLYFNIKYIYNNTSKEEQEDGQL